MMNTSSGKANRKRDPITHRGFKKELHKLYKKNWTYFDEVKDEKGEKVKVLKNTAFVNWGRTVENIPELTFFPTSKITVQNIVAWAKQNGKRVRAAGYRHTWGDLYSATDQVLISMLDLDLVTQLPAKHPPIDPNNDLQGIKIVGTIEENGVTKGLCRIGAATTNEQFRQWASGEGVAMASGWTVPLNVIMVEISWGGSNAPICHGAGLQHKTLSDLVYEIEYVDVNGNLQTLTDEQQLKAAAGCFGLLGIVTAVTLKLDKMTYANMRPVKECLGLAVPPPQGFPIPKGVSMKGISAADLEKAYAKFVERIETSYYSEFFWFAFQKKAWVNCWKNDGDPADSKPYPSRFQAWLQGWEEYIAQLMTESSLFRKLSPAFQARLLAGSAMLFLPNKTANKKAIVTPVIDGLHFRRGIQNMRVYDMEWEIPIPARADDPTKPDWSVCQQAWWLLIRIFYERYNKDKSDVPMRLTLEMRIMADSNITMAPQYGNSFGTCSIEILTVLTTPQKEWQAFLQEVTTAWTAIKGEDGSRLNMRPHWAKQWAGLQVDDMEIVDYLKNVAYKTQIPAFKSGLASIAQAQGYTLSDMQARFSNPLLDNIFEEVFRR